MFWFFWSDETHGDAEILGIQIWNFRYANMDFYKTSHIKIWFLGKDPVFEYEFLVLFSLPPVRITWKVLCTRLVWFCHHKMVMMLHFVRLEACLPGGMSAWRRWAGELSSWRPSAGGMSDRRHLLNLPTGGMSSWRSVRPGGVSAWRRVRLEACPPGGVSSWRLVCWRDDCQPSYRTIEVVGFEYWQQVKLSEVRNCCIFANAFPAKGSSSANQRIV